MDRYTYTAGYRELRALVEELLRAPSGPPQASLAAALRESLRLHCRSCGDLLDRQPRQQGTECCYSCG